MAAKKKADAAKAYSNKLEDFHKQVKGFGKFDIGGDLELV